MDIISKSCVIVVPAYAKSLKDYEAASFRNTLRVFGGHREISLLTYKELDISVYREIAAQEGKDFSVKYFDKKYFKDVDSYSKLCLQRSFYQSYKSFDYMLICQLDAWAFRDDLDKWMNEGWDYIGAPWYWTDKNGIINTSELTLVGNGGFSLRRIKRFIDVLSLWYNFIGLKPLKALKKTDGVKRCIKTIMRHFILVYCPEMWRLIGQFPEDYAFCVRLRGTEMEMNTPTVREALYFSFEYSPTHSFELTNHVLPMGCHAFHRIAFDEFWKDYIKF